MGNNVNSMYTHQVSRTAERSSHAPGDCDQGNCTNSRDFVVVSRTLDSLGDDGDDGGGCGLWCGDQDCSSRVCSAVRPRWSCCTLTRANNSHRDECCDCSQLQRFQGNWNG